MVCGSRKALVHAPNAPRIRLELARAFYLDGDFENSFRQFHFAKAGNLPPGVGASIERYLTAIRLRKNWSYNLTFSVAPDTNINNGTSAREADLFGLPFQLGDETRRKSGIGIAVDGGVEIAPKIGDLTRWRAGVAVSRREYEGRDFDDGTLASHAGPRLVRGRWDVSLLGTAYRRWYGHRRLSDGIGARVEANWYAKAGLTLSLDGAAQRLTYRHSPLQSGPAYSASVLVVRTLTPSSGVTGRIGSSRQAARSPAFANWSGGAGIGYFRELPGGHSIYLEPAYSLARFDGVDPLFAERRRDQLIEMRVGLLNRRIVFSRFTPRITYTFSRRRSNIDVYDFTQNRFEVGFTSTF